VINYDRMERAAEAVEDVAILGRYDLGEPSQVADECSGSFRSVAGCRQFCRRRLCGERLADFAQHAFQFIRAQRLAQRVQQAVEDYIVSLGEVLLGVVGEGEEPFGFTRARSLTGVSGESVALERCEVDADGVVRESECRGEFRDGGRAPSHQVHDPAPGTRQEAPSEAFHAMFVDSCDWWTQKYVATCNMSNNSKKYCTYYATMMVFERAHQPNNAPMKILLLAAALLVAIPNASAAQDYADATKADAVPTKTVAATSSAVTTAADLQLDLRNLWNGHVLWVRSVVFATHYDDANAISASDAKAVENARELADAITPFYGEEGADQLYELLGGHYGAIREYMTAHFADDAAAQDLAMTNLSANAEGIADFLEGANPDLPKATVLPLLETHAGHHAEQISAVHAEDFAREAEILTAMVEHIYSVSDAMASAITKQFPDKVTG